MNFRVMDDICGYAREYFADVEIVVVTNGVHSRKQRQWLIDNRVSTRISFDGVMHATNRPLAKSDASSVVIVERTITELIAAGVPLTVQLTVTRDSTARMIESIERIASSACATSKSNRSTIPYSREENNHWFLTSRNLLRCLLHR